MFKKKEFDDERRDIPDFWKLVIVIAFVVGAFIAADKITDYAYEQEMKMQYQTEYIVEE